MLQQSGKTYVECFLLKSSMENIHTPSYGKQKIQVALDNFLISYCPWRHRERHSKNKLGLFQGNSKQEEIAIFV